MQIRIISTPPGEAPEEVRQAWIGLVLPVSETHTNSDRIPVAGVLSAPKSFLGVIAGLFTGKVTFQSGFVVPADKAVELLAERAPVAADWWRQNAARCIAPGKRFVFSKDTCELVPDDVVA